MDGSVRRSPSVILHRKPGAPLFFRRFGRDNEVLLFSHSIQFLR
jgi:hypothetical protein